MDHVIHAGSCLDLVSTDLEYDVMICDPPYSDHVHNAAISVSGTKGVRKRDLGFASLSEELRQGIVHLAAQAKRWVLIYSDLEGAHLWREAMPKTYIRSVPWVRWSMPQLSGDRPPSGCELLLLFHRAGKKRWSGPGNLTHLAHKCMRGEAKHKTQKPLDQLLDLVSWFSEPGELILDPTCGAGTTGLACRELDRHFAGHEIDPVWSTKAITRLATPLAGTDITHVQRWKDSCKT